MGIDRRPSQGGRARTDTMLVLRLNPETQSAGMLSIPRDLYVPIPGRGNGRVNSAYVYGGGDLARQTVEDALAIEIDYYAAIDFIAFTTFVDEIGGVDIDVPRAINDPKYPDHNYGYDPLYIPAGPQHMDGTTALAYARSRHSDSDFERAARQQQVILALRDQLVDLNRLPHLLVRSPGLYQILADSIDSDLTFEQVVSLALISSEVSPENISSAVIDRSHVTSTVLRDGSNVLLPHYDRIETLVEQTLP
jgi:LCP family protein required for cell wall assembly